jgi:hypothetical protein
MNFYSRYRRVSRNNRAVLCSILGTFLLLGTLTCGAAPLQLDFSQADLKGAVKKSPDRLSHWQKGGQACWTFTVKEPIEAQHLLIEYSTPSAPSVQFKMDDEQALEVKVRSTDDWKSFRWGRIDTVSLSTGTHTLCLSYAGEGYALDIRRIQIGGEASALNAALEKNDPQNILKKEMSLYACQGTWAETMVALRAAYQAQGTPPALSERDGKALWDDFPKQSDWFLQDNQVHGEWGEGVYDARKDYQYYFDSERDSTLEQKLIAAVLQEIDAPDLQEQLDRLTSRTTSPNDPAWLTLYEQACATRRQQRLALLLQKTDKLIYATHMNMGTIYLATEMQGCPNGSQLRVIDLSPEAMDRPLKDELLFDSNNGIVRDPELSFDGKKLLFAWRKTNKNMDTNGKLAPATGNYKIVEMTLADRSIRPLTTDETYGADFEPCYLPNGDIVFSSDRCVQEVTCGWGDCSNLYIMDGDGKYARRIGFDQTQTGFPHLLNDGRVIFTRRDYNDRGQSYAHALFVMNIDGTFQTEYYGNNSMAPTSIQHTRPIPGTRKTMGVAGGYHTTQGGKLVVIDPSKGRQNYEGLTFLNWEPTPLDQVNDENYCRTGEQYMYPYPLDENSFLVSFSPIGTYLTDSNGKLNKNKEHSMMRYHLYWMTLDGRRELLAYDPILSCTQAIPLAPRPRPMVRSSMVNYASDTGTCYVQDVYYGPSAEGIERGTIKKLRVVKLFYKPATIGAGCWKPNRVDVGPGRKYAGYGVHSVLPTGVGSASFDTKEILGEVEVHPDGSVMFEVPAREPIYFQLVDENGRVVQTMRSWATLMPNERFSCVGCHEENDSAPLPNSNKTMAMQRPPQQLQPVDRITGAPFSYSKVVQPIWDKHCVSCHAPGKKAEKIDLTNTFVEDGRNHTSVSMTRRKFHQSYLTLLKVKLTGKKSLDEGRSNDWVNYYTRMATVELTPPYFAGSTQSGLIKLLLNGHKKVKLTAEEIGAVAAWIDLNVPYVGEYDEMNLWDDAAKKLYRDKMEMRRKQEAIEAENIQAYIDAGQP